MTFSPTKRETQMDRRQAAHGIEWAKNIWSNSVILLTLLFLSSLCHILFFPHCSLLLFLMCIFVAFQLFAAFQSHLFQYPALFLILERCLWPLLTPCLYSISKLLFFASSQWISTPHMEHCVWHSDDWWFSWCWFSMSIYVPFGLSLCVPANDWKQTVSLFTSVCMCVFVCLLLSYLCVVCFYSSVTFQRAWQ